MIYRLPPLRLVKEDIALGVAGLGTYTHSPATPPPYDLPALFGRPETNSLWFGSILHVVTDNYKVEIGGDVPVDFYYGDSLWFRRCFRGDCLSTYYCPKEKFIVIENVSFHLCERVVSLDELSKAYKVACLISAVAERLSSS